MEAAIPFEPRHHAFVAPGREKIDRFAAEILVRTGYRPVHLGVRTISEHGVLVHVFRLSDHPTGSYAYAWGSPDCSVIVRPPPIDAEAAVLDAMRET